MKWIGATMVLAAFSLAQAEDVKLVRIPSMPDAKILHKEQPVYPGDAVNLHIQGVVKLTVAIDTTGHVENVRLLSGHRLLAPAAMQAARHWVFEPTETSGHAVRVITQISMPFTLDAYGNPVTTTPRPAPVQ